MLAPFRHSSFLALSRRLDHSPTSPTGHYPVGGPYDHQVPGHSARAGSLSRQPSSSNQFTHLTPVSRIQIGAAGGDRPLDKPTLVRPARTSLQHEPQAYHHQAYPAPPPDAHAYTPPSVMEQIRASNRLSQPDLTSMQPQEVYHQGHVGSTNAPGQVIPRVASFGRQRDVPTGASPPEKEQFEVRNA